MFLDSPGTLAEPMQITRPHPQARLLFPVQKGRGWCFHAFLSDSSLGSQPRGLGATGNQVGAKQTANFPHFHQIVANR